jgi:hypothetical protein
VANLQFSTTWITVHKGFNLFLANFHSKFEFPPIMKVVFQETMKYFCIGIF